MGGPFSCRTSVLTLRNMTININGEPGAARVNTSTLWAAVCLLVAVIGAGVALALSGMETGAVIALLTGLVGIGGGLVAVLDRMTTVQRINAKQDQKLETIERRVNGELDQRIATAFDEKLTERFGPAPSSSAGVDESRSSITTGFDEARS